MEEELRGSYELCESYMKANTSKGLLTVTNALANVINHSSTYNVPTATANSSFLNCIKIIIDRPVVRYMVEWISGSRINDFFELGFMSSLLEGDEETARKCLKYVENRVGSGSRRVLLSHIMMEEFSCKNLDIVYLKKRYGAVISSSELFTPVDIYVLKRIAAIHSSAGDFVGAIDTVNSILKYSSGDSDSWLALVEYYFELCDYSKSVFCIDELLLLNPDNHLLFCMRGEAYFAMKTDQSMEKAINSFIKSLKLQGGTYMRALLGLSSACYEILEVRSAKGEKRKVALGVKKRMTRQMEDLLESKRIISDSDVLFSEHIGCKSMFLEKKVDTNTFSGKGKRASGSSSTIKRR